MCDRANQRMLHFTKMRYLFIFSPMVTLILFLDSTFALCCTQRQIGFSMNLRCRLVFFPMWKIAFSPYLSCGLVLPNWLTRYIADTKTNKNQQKWGHILHKCNSDLIYLTSNFLTFSTKPQKNEETKKIPRRKRLVLACLKNNIKPNGE